MTYRLLLDANAWLDYFLDRGLHYDAVSQLVSRSYIDDSINLCTSVNCTANVYYMVRNSLKRTTLKENGEITEGDALAANETAWACLRTLRDLSFIVPADESDMLEATIMREKHPDYEDNLVAAAAKRMKATCIVTSDEQMLKHQPYPCVTVEEALKMVEKEGR